MIRTLAERFNAESRRCIEEGLAGVRDQAGLERAYVDLLDQYYEIIIV